MNIFTVPYGSNDFYARPDTSLNKDSNDYFCPDYITGLAASVFVYARAIKAGKSVASKFAPRYYNAIGTGVHFWVPEMVSPDSPQTWWMAHSLDNTTFLSGDEADAASFPAEITERINNAFATISRNVSFRTGDYIAIEISKEEMLGNGHKSYRIKEKEINLIW